MSHDACLISKWMMETSPGKQARFVAIGVTTVDVPVHHIVCKKCSLQGIDADCPTLCISEWIAHPWM